MRPLSYIIYFIISFPVFLLSCTEKVDIPLDQITSTIVIEGVISNTMSNNIVKISSTQAYFDDSQAHMIEGALVSVKDSSSTYYFTETQPGIYLLNFLQTSPGREYVLNVELGDQIYTASTIMPRTPGIDSISFEKDDTDRSRVFIKMYGQENPLPGDYYFWGVYKDFSYQTDNITKLFHLSDILINGSYIDGLKVQTIEARPGSRIDLQMASIPGDYYYYSIAILKETVYTTGPFKPAPANLTGNISNGALGFFYAYNEDLYTAIVFDIE